MLTAACCEGSAEAAALGPLPLLQDLGIDLQWRVAHPDRSAQPLHVAAAERLGHAPQPPRAGDRHLAQSLDGSYDAVIVHGVELAARLVPVDGLGRYASSARWAWWCHCDPRALPPQIQAGLLDSLRLYSACVFEDPRFILNGLDDQRCVVIPPAINLCSPRNQPLAEQKVRGVLARLGVDPQRPLLVQVGPLTTAADPLGALAVYRRVKPEYPRLQMLLLRPFEQASAEVWANLDLAVRQAGGDPDVHLAAVQGPAGRLAVNAARRAASVVMQRSGLPNGALPLLEAQWQGCRVVTATDPCTSAACVPATWYRAEDEQTFAQAVLHLLDDGWEARLLSAAGREHVRTQHLLPSALEELIRLLLRLLVPETRCPPPRSLAGRDAPA
jgi:trehalose synthase